MSTMPCQLVDMHCNRQFKILTKHHCVSAIEDLSIAEINQNGGGWGFTVVFLIVSCSVGFLFSFHNRQ